MLKMNSKWRHHGSVGGVWAPKSRPKGSRTAKRDLVCGHWRARDRHFEEFQTIVRQRCVFLEMWENLWKTCVFQGFEGVRTAKLGPPGLQSGVQEGSGQAKGASERMGTDRPVGFCDKAAANQRYSAQLSAPQRTSAEIRPTSSQGRAKNYLRGKTYDQIFYIHN